MTTVVQLPDFHVEIIAASVAVGVLLILIVLAMKVCWLFFLFVEKLLYNSLCLAFSTSAMVIFSSAI